MIPLSNFVVLIFGASPVIVSLRVFETFLTSFEAVRIRGTFLQVSAGTPPNVAEFASKLNPSGKFPSRVQVIGTEPVAVNVTL